MSRTPASERRQALARAALAVISRDGLAAATTRAIVAEAGMPLSSFHYAVASRDELLGDVISLVVAQEGVAVLSPLLERAGSVREAASLAFWGYFEFVRSDPGHEQALFELTQYALRTPGLDHLPAEQYARYHVLAIELLDVITTQFQVEWSIPVRDLARLLVSFSDGITLAWLANRDDAAAERAIDVAAEALTSFARTSVTT